MTRQPSPKNALLFVGYNAETVRSGDLQVDSVAGADELPAGLDIYDAIAVRASWPSSESAKQLRAWRDRVGPTPLLLLCEPGEIRMGVEALQLGADDYLSLPLDGFELRTRLGRLWDRSELDSQLAFYQEELTRKPQTSAIEARSEPMRAVLSQVSRVAPMRSTVLIYGESGVGKELIARSIHFQSNRAEKPFIALNCAAMPANLIETELFGHERGAFTGAHSRVRGKFEVAHRGTLFLDEIGEMDPGTQAKLLRVLEEREFMRVGGTKSVRVDVRVIAATNAPLEERIADQTFRRDLYYRLKVVTLRVPPLRDRRSDIPALIERFLAQLSSANALRPKRIEPDALEALRLHRWPGNVRELKNVLESLIVSVPGETIDYSDLPPSIQGNRRTKNRSRLEPGTTLEEMERELIRRTLEHTGGNRTHSADMLGIGVRTLQRKIRSYGIRIPPTRRRSRS